MKTVHVAILGTVAAVAAVFLITKAARAAGDAAGAVWGSVADGVSSAADYVWNGPASAPQDYAAAVEATRGGGLNPFVNNPNNVNPNDLIPPGYRVNQWGGLEPI